MKKSIFLIIALLLIITGCSTSSSGVSLLSESGAKRIARRFGTSTYNGIIESSSDKIVYSFTDELGFDYQVVSTKKSISVDGSSFGYTSRNSTDYGIKYYEYLINTLSSKVSSIEFEYNVRIGNDDGWRSIKSALYETDRRVRNCSPTDYAFYSVYSSSINDSKKAGEELKNIIKEYDKKGYFENCAIWLRDDELNYNNVYARKDLIILK